jgi:hypothetical protein
MTITQLAGAFETAVEQSNYDDPFLSADDSILEAQSWFVDDSTIGARYASAVSAQHIVFGHDPGAIPPHGRIGVTQDGALFRIDCGMSPGVDYSDGALLRVTQAPSGDVADALLPDGTVTRLWP